MKKKLFLKDEKKLEEFLSVFAIGLCYCLENDLIDSSKAEQWLFSPIVAYSLKESEVSNSLIEAMKYSSEIDACKNSEYYKKSIINAKEKFLDIIKKTKNEKNEKKQIESLLDIFK